jgi:hypothetical protein
MVGLFEVPHTPRVRPAHRHILVLRAIGLRVALLRCLRVAGGQELGRLVELAAGRRCVSRVLGEAGDDGRVLFVDHGFERVGVYGGGGGGVMHKVTRCHRERHWYRADSKKQLGGLGLKGVKVERKIPWPGRCQLPTSSRASEAGCLPQKIQTTPPAHDTRETRLSTQAI